MNPYNFDQINEPLDQATADRLAKLRAMPVDTSRLEKRVRRQIPRPRRFSNHWLRSLSAAAASLAIVGLIAAVLWNTSGGPVLASPALMAKMHQEIVDGRVPVIQVDSIEQANKVLAGKWPQTPELPQAPDAHVMACCMKSIRDKKVVCVLLKSEGQPLTMTVANASDMKLPQSPSTIRGGAAYYLQSFESLNMVMTERHGRWVCLIGELPAEQIMDIASRLQY